MIELVQPRQFQNLSLTQNYTFFSKNSLWHKIFIFIFTSQAILYKKLKYTTQPVRKSSSLLCSIQQRALSKTSPIDFSNYLSRNTEHSESNTRSVMKKPKIIKNTLRGTWCSIFIRSMFLKKPSERSLPGYFSLNAEHSKSNTRSVMRIPNLSNVQKLLLFRRKDPTLQRMQQKLKS